MARFRYDRDKRCGESMSEENHHWQACQTTLVRLGRLMHDMGLVPATSGNLSMRLDAHNLAVTASGCHKGRLREADILCLDLTGETPPARPPSAETALHVQLYQLFPDCNVVLHGHGLAATVLSRRAGEFVWIEGYELQKAIRGQDSHTGRLGIPVFDNHQDMAVLTARVAGRVADLRIAQSYLIRGHGFYAWGRDADEALRHVEALDFLLRCVLAEGETR